MPTHLILNDRITLLVQSTNYEAPYYAIIFLYPPSYFSFKYKYSHNREIYHTVQQKFHRWNMIYHGNFATQQKDRKGIQDMSLKTIQGLT
jgi:hypothetical protein